MAGCFIPAIKQMADDALAEQEAAKEAQVQIRSGADDGMGSGDLAI